MRQVLPVHKLARAERPLAIAHRAVRRSLALGGEDDCSPRGRAVRLSTMTKGEEYQKRALAAEAHAATSLGITRAHFLESAKQWREKACEAGYLPIVEKARRSRRSGNIE